ncbi:MAG: TnsA endonuclease C-terminal domain-containing protein [Pyrinomonadaceae bacterium]|nr:TnsA endonuclease C-terminal domain-containing protein [Pyrinomonadaceae bacterium]
MQIEIGTCLRLFRHLVARKEILLDLTQKIDLNKSAQSLVTITFDRERKELVA